MAGIVTDNWRAITGQAISQGVDLRTLDLDMFCSYVWWWSTQGAEKESDIAKFESQLWRPPPGKVAQGPWSAEAETSAFAALKAGLG